MYISSKQYSNTPMRTCDWTDNIHSIKLHHPKKKMKLKSAKSNVISTQFLQHLISELFQFHFNVPTDKYRPDFPTLITFNLFNKERGNFRRRNEKVPLYFAPLLCSFTSSLWPAVWENGGRFEKNEPRFSSPRKYEESFYLLTFSEMNKHRVLFE